MATLNDLVNFIESNPPADDYTTWEQALESTIPNFKYLVKDPNNWPTLEKIKPKDEQIYGWLYDKFFRDLDHNDRLELAKHWFYSSNERLREEAKRWINYWDIESPADWTGLDDNMKNQVLMYLLETMARSVERLSEVRYSFDIFYRDLHYIEPELHHLLHVYYEANKLKEIIQQSKDPFIYIELIDDHIDKIMKFFSTPIIKYIPDKNELELINSLMGLFKANGYSSKRLPDIYLSFETPPLFIKYPELDDMSRYIDEFFDRKRKERDKKIVKDERKPEFYDIEELLGVYIPNPKIILYARGLIWCAKTLNVDERVLLTVVLIHEIGHWITHQLPPNKIKQWFKTQLLPNFKHKHKLSEYISNISKWPTVYYNKTSTNVHEGWAQILTWWIVNNIGGNLKDTFDKLNQRQSQPYHVYKDLTNEDINTLIKTLVMLRMLNKGATLFDWFTFLKLLKP